MMSSVCQSHHEGQRDIEALNKKFEPKQQELAKLNTDIQGLQTQLKAQGEKMNDDARNQLAKQIEQKQRSLQQGAEGAQADYQSEANDIGTRIGQKIMKVLDKYAKENGYVVILSVSDQQTPVLWANLQAADAIKRASNSGSDVVNEILAGNPQVQASDPFALLENRTITGRPRQISG